MSRCSRQDACRRWQNRGAGGYFVAKQVHGLRCPAAGGVITCSQSAPEGQGEKARLRLTAELHPAYKELVPCDAAQLMSESIVIQHPGLQQSLGQGVARSCAPSIQVVWPAGMRLSMSRGGCPAGNLPRVAISTIASMGSLRSKGASNNSHSCFATACSYGMPVTCHSKAVRVESRQGQLPPRLKCWAVCTVAHNAAGFHLQLMLGLLHLLVHIWQSPAEAATAQLVMHLADGCIGVQQAPAGVRGALPPPDVHKQHRT